MPTCKKCNNHFPNHIVIDGKHRVLCNRKYCLECSPFDLHNTRKLDGSLTKRGTRTSESTGQRKCDKCGKEYTWSSKNTKGHGLNKCNSCIVNARRASVKKKCVEYKGGKCEICGYNKCMRSLVFHHKNPDEKEFSIGGFHCLSWKRIKVELDKCVLLCHNCHGEEHERLDCK